MRTEPGLIRVCVPPFLPHHQEGGTAAIRIVIAEQQAASLLRDFTV